MKSTTKKTLLSLAIILFIFSVLQSGSCVDEDNSNHSTLQHIGTTIGTPIDLKGDSKIEGIAYDEKSQELFVLRDVDNDLEGNGLADTGEQVQIYAYNPVLSNLDLCASFTIPAASNTGDILCDARGLAISEYEGRRILHILSLKHVGTKDADGKDNFHSLLWRVDFTQPASIQAEAFNLNQEVFDLRNAEVFDLACDKSGRVYISFDASKQAVDINTQRSRGILRIQFTDGPQFSKMLPANGKTPSHHNLGLTLMEMDDHEYLIGTIEELSNNDIQEIYVAEAETGRGLFMFDAPPMTGDLNTDRRLAYGAGVLWVGEQKKGLYQVQRVIIRDNVYEPLVGYKRPRRIQITITSEAKCSEGEACGSITHNFGHPLGNEIKPSQGSYFEGYSLQLTSPQASASFETETENYSIQDFSYSPMDDPTSLGHVTQVQYPSSSRNHGIYKTVFHEDFWTREYRNFVYPHLANNTLGILEDTDFKFGHLRKGDPAIIDSLPRFHWTHQEQIFEDFIGRVKAYILEKYGVEADLTNPYWAARNVLEYIRDNYNYPDPVASEDGSGDSLGNVVDPDNFHLANGPAVYKMIMTDPRFGDDIHGRRTGCMAAGGMFLAVMRYMGFPARWMGTSQQRITSGNSPYATGVFYDENQDGMFNGDDYMDASHGHYTNEVYLGPGYGWQRFDASPNKPDDRDSDGLDYEDYAFLHSRDSQYELMRRKITPGHQPHAVASSLGVGHNEHFFQDANKNRDDCEKLSVFHEDTGVYTSACKGYQSYDFVSKYENPEKVITRYDLDARMMWRPCLTFDVVLKRRNAVTGENEVEFTPRGPWAIFEPDARVEIVLRIERGDGDSRVITHKILKTDIAWDKGRETVNIPKGISGDSIHIQVRKIGVEKFIGGASPRFTLNGLHIFF